MGNTKEINVQTSTFSEQVVLSETHLQELNAEIYRMDNILVKPYSQEYVVSGRKVSQKVMVPKLSIFDENSLRVFLGEHINYVKFSGQGRNLTNANPSVNLAKAILSRVKTSGFKEIYAVSNCPTIDEKGNLLCKEGYNEEYKIYFSDLPEILQIPENITRKQAKSAIDIVYNNLLSESPFKDNVSKSVALSCLITPIIRHLFNVVPMHIIRANTPSAGKTYIMHLASLLLTGVKAYVSSAGQKTEETEKKNTFISSFW